MQVHLALPGLLWPARVLPDVVFDLDLPALSWLLGRARRVHSAPLGFENWLAGRFGHDTAAPPLAALRLLGEDDVPGTPNPALGDTHWICADPAHIGFAHGHPQLADPSRLALDADEIAAIAVSLAPTFSAVGHFLLRPGGEGYVKLAAPAAITTALPTTVGGQGPAALLPRGPDAARWIRLANDAQMALHGLDLNRRREAAGEPTVNTLMFWGAGRLPSPTAANHAANHAHTTGPYQKVGGSGTVARGLARHAGIQWQSAVEPVSGESTLLIDERLRGPAQQGDAFAWRDALAAIERERLAPLVARLRAGGIQRLRLTGLGDDCTLDLDLGRFDALRLWRRPRPLASMAETATP